jgi:hypothetical protein
MSGFNITPCGGHMEEEEKEDEEERRRKRRWAQPRSFVWEE